MESGISRVFISAYLATYLQVECVVVAVATIGCEAGFGVMTADLMELEVEAAATLVKDDEVVGSRH